MGIECGNVRTFRIPISTAVRTLKSSFERYLRASTSSFMFDAATAMPTRKSFEDLVTNMNPMLWFVSLQIFRLLLPWSLTLFRSINILWQACKNVINWITGALKKKNHITVAKQTTRPKRVTWEIYTFRYNLIQKTICLVFYHLTTKYLFLN